MFVLSMMMLQAVVGSPLPQSTTVKVLEAKRVGQELTVRYLVQPPVRGRPVEMPTIVDPAGRTLKARSPKTAPRKVAPQAAIDPSIPITDTVTFDVVADTVNDMVPPTFNQSMWYFVVGGQRVPFRF